MPALRLALAQMRPAKGDYAENIRRIGGVLAQVSAWDAPPDLVVFPETATSGYFVEGGVRDVAVTAGTLARDLQRVHAEGKARPLDAAVGFYEVFENHYYNSCLYVTLGGRKPLVRHVHRKIFLPTYGVFDEERFVDRGREVRSFETATGLRAAMLICEDVWHSISATIAAVNGAQLLIVPSAPPARGSGTTDDGLGVPASAVRWERLARGIAEEHGLYVALTNLVGFEGGKGFPGGSIVVGPGGDVLARGPLFEEGIVAATIDPAEITRARSDTPLLADLEMALPHLAKQLGKREEGRGKRKSSGVKFDPAVDGEVPTLPSSRFPLPVTGSTASEPDPLVIDPALVTRWLEEFLRDEVVRRRRFEKGIVALSGGVDSAVTAHLAVRALGRDRVIGLRLPYRTSSPESLEHAALVGEQLGIALRTVDITDAVEGYYRGLGEPGDAARRGNVMARARMIALFDLSAALRALPLGTGNKTERLLGYFTWHADDSPPVNPLGDLFKTQVWALARHLGVPAAIVDKAPTADLVQGQTDEGDLGISYARADHILHWLLRGLSAAEVAARGYAAEEVELVRRRLETTHWKRRLPTVAMLSQTAIGEYYLRPVDY